MRPMQPDHLQFARQTLAQFTDAAIQRLSVSGDFVYRYTLSVADIKGTLGLARLKSSVIEDYIGFFSMNGCSTSYNEQYEAFNIEINLNSVVLSPYQAEGLSTAMAHFRANN